MKKKNTFLHADRIVDVEQILRKNNTNSFYYKNPILFTYWNCTAYKHKIQRQTYCSENNKFKLNWHISIGNRKRIARALFAKTYPFTKIGLISSNVYLNWKLNFLSCKTIYHGTILIIINFQRSIMAIV